MSRILAEYHGFLKFISYAQTQTIKWFGPYCQYDPCQIIVMSARDWDGMVDEERLYFIREHYLDSPNWKDKLPTSKNAFLSFLLDRSFDSEQIHKSPSHLNSGSYLSSKYRMLSQEDKQEYNTISLPSLGIRRVLERRDKLHQMHKPLELNRLEYIIKTLPKRPINPRIWFHVLRNTSLDPKRGQASWEDLSPEQKSFFEDCSRVDRRRYKYEKNAWLTRLSQIDFNKQDWSLKDFQLLQTKPQLDALYTIIELNKDRIPSSARAKRPPGPFALFLKDFYSNNTSERIYDKENIRKPVETWYKLADEEKQSYKTASQCLSKSYKQTQTTEGDNLDLDSISKSLFRHMKNLTGSTAKAPSLEDFYGKAEGIQKKLRKENWNSLPQAAKEPYIKKYEALKLALQQEHEQLEEKLQSSRDLIVKAKELRETKRDMGLIKVSKRISRSLYPDLNDS